jgi:hypothetical protein
MKMLTITSMFCLWALASCAPHDNTFYWGEYSSTLYDFKKDPSEKTLEAHKKQLLLIIEESGKKNKKAPPGVNAEYAYFLLKEGKEADGMEYLEREKTLYPESTIFIERIRTEYSRGKK